MDYQTILLEKKDNVTTLTMNRPEKLNAMNTQMTQELKQAYQFLEQDDETKVIVLTGAGRAFCTGGDANEYLDSSGKARQKYDIIPKPGEFIGSDILNIRKPVIAMVNGMAIGAGCGMTLCSDMVIASENAKFAISFTKRGMAPAYAITYLLPRLVGIHRACEIILTSKTFDANEAKDMGLVNHVVPADQLAKVTYEMAYSVAKLPPLAIRSAKRLLYLGMESDLSHHLQLEILCRHYMMGTEDFIESTKAFLEKREPIFKGK